LIIRGSYAGDIGEAVQQAETTEELLQVASTLWLPSDPDLPSHLKQQALHHERRQRWSAQLLNKLGENWLHPHNDDSSSSTATTKHTAWQDERLARAVIAASLPFRRKNPSSTEDDNHSIHAVAVEMGGGNEKERRAVREALVGLHTMAGQSLELLVVGDRQLVDSNYLPVHQDILKGTKLLIERAEAMAEEISLQEAVEVRWAARGLLAMLGPEARPHDSNQHNDTSTEWVLPRRQFLSEALPRLEKLVAALPFDILPRGIDLTNIDWLKRDSEDNIQCQADIMSSLLQSIPFHFDTIVTRTGSSVTERRGTAWVAEEGIGALAYSGKLMPPSPVPSLVRSIMRAVEQAIDVPSGNFDCALCNYYPDGELLSRWRISMQVPHGSGAWHNVGTPELCCCCRQC
jgi:hypothetical protein